MKNTMVENSWDSRPKDNESIEVELIQDGEDLILPIPDSVMEEMGWKEGEDLEWEVTPEGKIILKSVDISQNLRNNTKMDHEYLIQQINDLRNEVTNLRKEKQDLIEKNEKLEQLVDALTIDVAILKGEV